MPPRIALATCADFPDLEPTEAPLPAALRALAVAGVPVVPTTWYRPGESPTCRLQESTS